MAGIAIDPKLLADILERPLDDGPRLVAADALQEKGDPRGLFIVAQCRLAERGVPRDERAELKAQVKAILSKHAKVFAGEAEPLDHELRRGFVDEVTASASALGKVAGELFKHEPITRLTITSTPAKAIAPLAEAGAFARVVRLTIRGTLKNDGAHALAEALAKRKHPLDALNLGATEIGAAGAAALASALTGCRSLALTGNAIGDEGLAELARAKALASLETLYVTDSDLTDEGLETLAGSAILGSLARLSLARNEEVTKDGLRALAASKKLRRLRWLEYSDEDGLQSIVTRP